MESNGLKVGMTLVRGPEAFLIVAPDKLQWVKSSSPSLLGYVGHVDDITTTYDWYSSGWRLDETSVVGEILSKYGH